MRVEGLIPDPPSLSKASPRVHLKVAESWTPSCGIACRGRPRLSRLDEVLRREPWCAALNGCRPFYPVPFLPNTPRTACHPCRPVSECRGQAGGRTPILATFLSVHRSRGAGYQSVH